MENKPNKVPIPRGIQRKMLRAKKTSWLNRVSPDSKRYLVTHFDGKEAKESTMFWKEKDKLDAKSVDLFLDEAAGEIFLKHESKPSKSKEQSKKPKHPKGPGWRDLKVGYEILVLLRVALVVQL